MRYVARAQRGDAMKLGEIERDRRDERPAPGHPWIALAKGDCGPRGDALPGAPRRGRERDADDRDERHERHAAGDGQGHGRLRLTLDRRGEVPGPGGPPPATRMLVAQRGKPSKRATSTRRRKFAHRTSPPMPMTIASRATRLGRDASPAVGSSRAISGATRTASATVGAPGALEKTRAATRPRTTGDVQVTAVAQPPGPGPASADARRTKTTSRMAARGATTAAYHQSRLTPGEPESTWVSGRGHRDDGAGEEAEQASDLHPAQGGDRHRAIIAVRAESQE